MNTGLNPCARSHCVGFVVVGDRVDGGRPKGHGQNAARQASSSRANTRAIDSKDEFYAFFTPKSSAKPEIHGGFALTHWDGSRAVEEQIAAAVIQYFPAQRCPLQCSFVDAPVLPPIMFERRRNGCHRV